MQEVNRVLHRLGGWMLLALCATAGAQETAMHTPPPASAYAGDAACATCHAAVAKTYSETGHAHDSAPATAKAILGDFTPGKNVVRLPDPNVIYAMIAAPDGFYQAAMNIANPQSVTGQAENFDIVIGSGRLGQNYFYWQEDELFQLPVAYWSQAHEWMNSPGYNDGRVHFDRPIAPRCLECHATTFQSTGPPENKYVKDSVVLGIGCEKCHGPGAEHVARERVPHPPAAGSAEIAIVNPARLPQMRQMDLCGLCHGGPGIPLAPALSFRPGDDLARYVALTPAAEDAPVDVHGNQVEAIERSKCFTSGKLTCATCHDVHRTEEKADAFSAKCLECHKAQACPKFRVIGESIRTKCVGCHMPLRRSQIITSNTEGKQYSVIMRSHRIAVYRDETGSKEKGHS